MARRTKVERMLARFERRFGPDVFAEPEVSAEPATPVPASAVVRFVPEPRPPALPVPLPVAPLLPAPAVPAAPTPEASPTRWVHPLRSHEFNRHDPVCPILLTTGGLVRSGPEYVEWSGSKQDVLARQRLEPRLTSAWDRPPLVCVALPPPMSIGRWFRGLFS